MVVSASVETGADEQVGFLTPAEVKRFSVNFEMTVGSSELLVLETLIRKTVREELDSRFVVDLDGIKGEPASTTISVAELASNINQSEGTTRKMLLTGRIPGARRKDPRKS